MAAIPGPPPSMQDVWQQVHTLYSAQSNAERTAADEWLQKHQASAAAWTSLDLLLRAEGLPEEGYFFAANSLRSKIRRNDVMQLEEGAREQLRASLMEHIFKFRHGPMVVRKQLCLAFSEYAGKFNGGKADIVQDVCTSLSQSPETVPVLLEILLLLGEEADHCQEKFQGLPPDESHPLLISAWAAALGVLNFLHQCFETAVKETDAAARSRACKPIVATFCRWLRFGAVGPEQLVQSPIVHAALQSLADPELYEPASDLICELAYVSRDLTTGAPVFQLLTSNLGNFYTLYQGAVQKEDETGARAIARIVSEMGESYCDVLSQASADAVQMVQLLVQVASHPETRIATLTYSFWWRLCSTLKACDDATRAQRVQALREPLLQLARTLAASAVCPEDCDEWDQPQEDEWTNFRMETLYDAMLDVCDMLGGVECLQATGEGLAAQVAACHADAEKWRQVEGSLFFVRATARYIPKTEGSLVPSVLSLGPQLPGHWRVRMAFTVLVGKLGRWLDANPAMLGGLLEYIVQGLGMPRVGKASAEALQDLCESCAGHLASPDKLQGLLSIYRNMGGLQLGEQEKIVEGLGSVLCRVPTDQLTPMIAAAAQPATESLQAAVRGGAKSDLIQSLKKLRMLIKGGVTAAERDLGVGGGDQHRQQQAAAHRQALANAWMGTFGKIWPVLEQVIASHGGDEDTMEEVMRCSKNAMQAMNLAFRDFLAPFATACVNAFMRQPMSCVLYAVTTLVSVFGRDAQYVQPLCDMCGALGGKTFEILSQPDAFTQRPDIVTEFFELIGRGVRRFPRAILSAPFADTAFQCACASMYTDLAHRESLHSLLTYFDNIASADANEHDPAQLAEDRQFAAQFMMQPGKSPGETRGVQMCRAMLHAVVTKPSVCVEPTAACCLSLKRLMPQQAEAWIGEGLQSLGPEVPIEARRRFMQDMMAATNSKGAKEATRGLYRSPKA